MGSSGGTSGTGCGVFCADFFPLTRFRCRFFFGLDGFTGGRIGLASVDIRSSSLPVEFLLLFV